MSVSAEVFGRYHQQEAFVAKKIEKSLECRVKIRLLLQNEMLFQNLDDKDLEVVIDAIESCKVNKGETIIKEGEPGQCLYIVESGELSCHKVLNGKNTHLKNYGPGEVFGELALLYNAPRAATIKALSDSECWVLDRLTFNHIVKDAAQKKRKRYETFLQTVPILSSMDHYERSKMADAIKETKFKEGDVIIKQGDQGDVFYILVDGTAKATLNANPAQTV